MSNFSNFFLNFDLLITTKLWSQLTLDNDKYISLSAIKCLSTVCLIILENFYGNVLFFFISMGL